MSDLNLGGLALGIREQECEWEVEDADAVAAAIQPATASPTERWPTTWQPKDDTHDPTCSDAPAHACGQVLRTR
jgi:hypothetical protein